MRCKEKREVYEYVYNSTRKLCKADKKKTTSLNPTDKKIIPLYKSFKKLHNNETAILFGSGLTFLEYKEFSDSLEWLRVGVNAHHVIFPMGSEKNTFDLLFMTDSGHGYFSENLDKYLDSDPYYAKFWNYKNSDFWPYFHDTKKLIPYSWYSEFGRESIEVFDYDRGISHRKLMPTFKTEEMNHWKKDISVYPFSNAGMVSWIALLFLLYAGVKTVYLVGMDCVQEKAGNYYAKPRHFAYDNDDDEELKKELDDRLGVDTGPNESKLVRFDLRWITIKYWIEEHYPRVKIISVNPVALEGVMNEDIYL